MSELLSVDVSGTQQLAQAPAQLQVQAKGQGGGPIRTRQPKSNHGFNKLLPNRPKKANSAYTLFIKGFYERNRNSKLNPREKFLRAAEDWKNVSKTERAELEKACTRDRDRYEREMAVWKSQKDYLKRPPTNYGLFLQDTWAREKAAGRGRRDDFEDISRQASEGWSELSDREKQTYSSRYQNLRENYVDKIQEVRANGSLPNLNWTNRTEVLAYTPSQGQLQTVDAVDEDDDDEGYYDDEEDEYED